MSDEGFLSRWARRKAADRQGVPLPEPETVPVPAAPSAPAVPLAGTAASPLTGPSAGARTGQPTVEPVVEPPVLTLEDVAKLCPADDFAPFVARGVPAEVKAAAMKKLFADPHYNIMDGLDIYIDDYTKPDPIPLAMLKQLNQSKVLRLFESDDEAQQREGASEGGQAQVSQAQAEDADPAAALPADGAAGVSNQYAGMSPDDAAADPQGRSAPETRADASTRDIIGTNDSEQKPDRRT